MTELDKYVHILREDLPHVMKLLDWDEKYGRWIYISEHMRWFMHSNNDKWQVMTGSMEVEFTDLLSAITYCDKYVR